MSNLSNFPVKFPLGCSGYTFPDVGFSNSNICPSAFCPNQPKPHFQQKPRSIANFITALPANGLQVAGAVADQQPVGSFLSPGFANFIIRGRGGHVSLCGPLRMIAALPSFTLRGNFRGKIPCRAAYGAPLQVFSGSPPVVPAVVYSAAPFLGIPILPVFRKKTQ